MPVRILKNLKKNKYTMQITIVATKTCNHRPLLEQQLQDSGLQYKLIYFEDKPELIEKHGLKTSPLLIVNDEVVSVGMPEQNIVESLKKKRKIDINEKRLPKRDQTLMVPQPLNGEHGMAKVDTTWGKIQPMQVAKNIRTVDEIEVNEFLEEGQQVIDGRTPDFYNKSTIPGAKNFPHTEVAERMDELDRSRPAIFFCNGPQCPQSPTAIKKLLDAGYPPEKILYYRGGMHDWVTLGLPI